MNDLKRGSLAFSKVGEISVMRSIGLLDLPSLKRRLRRFKKNKVMKKFLEDRTPAKMLSNASMIAAIGALDTTSPFSSRKSPDLGQEGDKLAFDRITDALISESDS